MTLTHKASVALITLAACAGVQAGNNGITASVAAEKASLGKTDNVTVRLTITNTSAQPQMILKWHTAFGEIEESLFKITRDGVDVPYLGAHYKRGAPTAADYYLLKPGASHTVKVELSDMYDMSITGQYTVSYSAKSGNLFGTNEKAIGEVKSGAASIWIDGRQPRGTVSELAKAPSNPSPMAQARCRSASARPPSKRP
ncbi:hypothetical protein LP419_28690 [Massilia sp. H-1]|nr:hypothetical protein LP419_28690 [Massilia sp. H-1]